MLWSRRIERRGGGWVTAGAMLAALVVGTAIEARAQAQDSLPFCVGERLTYRVRVPRFGNVGRGAMWVEGPVEVRGRYTLLLRFDVQAGVGPVRAVDRTASWLDPERMTSLRFTKREKSPVSRGTAEVELFPDERRWTGAGGVSGESPTDAPLDELSFIYFLRTLPLDADSAYRFARHFEPERNPTTVRVVGRETLALGPDSVPTLLVEMRVRDARRYRGEGVIRIHLSDDEHRLPMRIESKMPVVGTTVLTLEAHTHPAERCGAGAL